MSTAPVSRRLVLAGKIGPAFTMPFGLRDDYPIVEVRAVLEGVPALSRAAIAPGLLADPGFGIMALHDCFRDLDNLNPTTEGA